MTEVCIKNNMEKTREHWSSQIGFLLAAIGSAVGLGLLWKFPYVIGQNGGGLFFLTYLLCLCFVGVPVFIGEILLGRHAQKGIVKSYETVVHGKSGWRVGGVLGVMASFIIMSFYSIIAGWGMSYILFSVNGFYQNHSIQEIQEVFTYLSQAPGITLLWHFIFTAITMAIVMAGVREGIERWSGLMVRVLCVLLLGFFVYACTLPGFSKALHFVFYPSTDNFTMASVLEALALALLTMSLGQGVMVSYGSYLSPKENLFKMAFVVAGSIIVVAVLAALIIFPVVFTFGISPSSGPSLVFQTLPILFAKLPGSTILSTLFFILFFFTALTSAIPLIEVVTANIMDFWGTSRAKTAFFTAVGTFICGIPSALVGKYAVFPEWQSVFGMSFMDTMNDFASIWLIPFSALITTIFLGWVLDKKEMRREFSKDVSSHWLFLIWYFFIRYFVPVVIIFILIQKGRIFS